jgi:hypothetical protein
MVPIAMVLCVYALYTFMWRDFKINHRDPGPYSAPLGPVMVAGMVGAISSDAIRWPLFFLYFALLYES